MEVDPLYHDLDGKRILVTGATGFIGGRLIERLAIKSGCVIRALVRNPSRAAGIARFKLEWSFGDVVDLRAVNEAAEGCDIIFHCAYGKHPSRKAQREVNVVGTRNVLEAACAASASRVVHLSTQLVYGIPEGGLLSELSPRVRIGESYSDTKAEGEEMARRYASAGLPVVVLQPTAVYGPGAPAYTVGMIRQLRSCQIPRINGGSGLLNMVYIDDLIDAMLLSALSDAAPGQAFLISGREPVTWREFYDAVNEMLGGGAQFMDISADEAKQFFRNFGKRKMLPMTLLDVLRREPSARHRLAGCREAVAARVIARSVLPKPAYGALRAAARRFIARQAKDTGQRPVAGMRRWMIDFAASTARVQIDKANSLLGYEPKRDFSDGMKRTAQWARWARLVE